MIKGEGELVEEGDGGVAVVGSTTKEEAEERREREREREIESEREAEVRRYRSGVCGRLTRVMAASLSVPERTKGKQRAREGRRAP